MSADNSADPSDVVNQVVGAFEQMRVPPTPSAIKTRQWLALQDLHPLTLGEGRGEGPPLSTATRTWRQRVAVGGIGLSAAAGLVWLLVAITSGSRLSAMEQMVKSLHEVKSCSYRLSTQNTFIKEGQTRPTRVVRQGQAWWVEPGPLWAAEKITHLDATRHDTPGELLVDILEILPAGKPGVLIDHKAKTFVRLPVLRAADIPSNSPLMQLRRVREQRGQVIRELGKRTIDGKSARGYVLALDGAAPGSGQDNLEVWLDPDTNLPLEFGYTIKNEVGPEFFRVTDCRWNIEVPPKLFDTTPPPGYREVEPPPDGE